jgi:polyisoprenyl-phosphate glycosyltransferase
MQHAQLIVVTPVFEDVEASSRLFQELAAEFGEQVFVVAVDDGSVRQPLPVSALQMAPVSGVILKLRRNVGHQKAIAVGIDHVVQQVTANQRVVVMDSDGEDVPGSIRTLLESLKREDVDVAVAHRKSRVETWRFKAFYAVYKRLFRLLTGRSISFGNFMALKAPAVKRLAAMQELPIHVAATVLASRLRTAVCPIDRGPRYAGQSKMNFVGLVLHGFKGLMVFAEDVLVRVGLACGLIAGGSVLVAGLAIVLKIIGYSSPGWFSVALGILVLIFLQTGTLTLMTLMLTGAVRGGTLTPTVAYRDVIEEVIATSKPSP